MRDFLYFVAAKAREKVIAFRGFTRAFLFGLIENSGPECLLPMLSQDQSTTGHIKQLIAEFLGVPEPRDIDRLSAASLNLLFMCIPDPNNLSRYCSDFPFRFYCLPNNYF